MDEKNIIINDYIAILRQLVETLGITANQLSGSIDRNLAILRTLNVMTESIRSQLTNIQNAIDEYNVGV